MKQSALTSLGRGGAANILVKGPGQLTRGDLPVWGPGARLSTSQNKKKSIKLRNVTQDLFVWKELLCGKWH